MNLNTRKRSIPLVCGDDVFLKERFDHATNHRQISAAKLADGNLAYFNDGISIP